MLKVSFQYACNFCNKRFQDKSDLDEHMHSHNFQESHICSICNISFPNKSSLAVHRTSHNKIPFKCPEGCGKVYKSPKTLSNHILKTHKKVNKFIQIPQPNFNISNDLPHTCQYCETQFDSPEELAIHVDQYHDETENFKKLYKCMDCPMIFKDFDNFVKHCIKHSKGEMQIEIDKDAVTRYQCKDCPAICDTYEDWLDHFIKEHIETKPLANANFSMDESKASEFEHTQKLVEIKQEPMVVLHQGIEHVKFEMSGGDFSPSKIKKEVEGARMPTEDEYNVEYLEEEYLSNTDENSEIEYEEEEYLESEDSLKDDFKLFNSSHQSTENLVFESGVQLYKCGICSEKFPHKEDFDEHIKTHTCEICNKIFKTKNYLLEHNKRLHETPLQNCIDCHKAFRKTGALRKHKCNQKSFYKSNTCHICKKVFFDRKVLENHIITHNKGEGLKCPLCGKQFLKRFMLTMHLRRHKRGSFSCPTCNKNYKMRRGYMEHIRNCGIMSSLVCKICGFSGFKEESSYLVHMRRHRGEDCYACELCNIPFKLKRDLKAHVLTHIQKFEIDSEDGEEAEQWLEEYLSEGFSSDS